MTVKPADIRSIPLFKDIPDARLEDLIRVFETMTLPVRGASWQVSGTETDTVLRAWTSNVAEPPQLVEPSTVLAESVMV